MRCQATVFSQALQQVPWGVFDKAVKRHGTDRRSRCLDSRSHLVALMAGQLFEARGLRDIAGAMEIHSKSLSRRGIEPVRRATLSDANSKRDPRVFQALIPALLARLRPTSRHVTDRALQLIDSTTIHPGAEAAAWAHYSNGVVAAKIHVVYDPKLEAPVFFHLTGYDCSDIAGARALIEPIAGTTYVFDRGYHDFRFWADLNAAGCRLVTRLKRKTRLHVVGERTRGADPDILSDRIVRLSARLTHTRRNPFSADGRVVEVRRESGEALQIFTNDLTSSARQIADLYKKRWDIEIFFRVLKQNLRIKVFYGRSENAVRLQIIVAIIVYLIMKIIHQAVSPNVPLQNFISMLKAAIFHRYAIAPLIRRATSPPNRPTRRQNLSPQLELHL